MALLRRAGYEEVESVASDDDAMTLLETEQFDLILLGRKSDLNKKGIDQRLREKYSGDFDSSYSSRNTDPQPRHVLEALSEMLGHDLRLTDLG